MSYPYLCLSCNGRVYSDKPGAIEIQCSCGKPAWMIRCNCTGQVDNEGQCVECGQTRG